MPWLGIQVFREDRGRLRPARTNWLMKPVGSRSRRAILPPPGPESTDETWREKVSKSDAKAFLSQSFRRRGHRSSPVETRDSDHLAHVGSPEFLRSDPGEHRPRCRKVIGHRTCRGTGRVAPARGRSASMWAESYAVMRSPMSTGSSWRERISWTRAGKAWTVPA